MAQPHEVLAPASIMSSLLVNTKAVAIGSRRISGFAHSIDLVRLVAADGREPVDRSGHS